MLHLFRDRRRTKLIWIAIAGGTILSFLIGFSILGGNSGSQRGGSSASLGSIYGQDIAREEFQVLLNKNLDNYRQRAGRELDDASMSYLRDQTWSQMITERVMTEEARRLGLTATDAEVLFAVRNMPPQELMQAPGLLTNGQFDMGKYRRALENPNENWLWLEDYQRKSLPTQKLQLLAGSLVKITDPDLQDIYSRTRDKVQVSLVLFPSSAGAVKPEEVTRPEMEAFYQKHATEFDRESETSLALVVVQKIASAADQKTAADNARTMYADAVKDTNFGLFASQVSEGQVGRTPDGKPGALVEKGQLPAPLEQAVFAMQPGQISQPTLVGTAYHIVKYVGTVKDQGKDKRHIIDLQVAVRPGEESLKSVYEKLGRVRDAARKPGLAAAAEREGLKAMMTGWMSEDLAPPLLTQMPELIQFGLTAKKGSVSQVIDKPTALLVAQVVDRRPAGRRKVAEVEGELRTRVAQEKSVDKAEARAREFMAQAGTAGSLEESAKRAGATLAGPLEFTRSGPYPPQLQYEPEVVGSAFGLPVGSVKVVRGDEGAFVLKVLGRTNADPAKFMVEGPQLRNQLYRERQQEVVGAWMRQLQKEAKVQDRRAELGL
jgi:peptidyl-prolyl cis-trans isomerase D